MKVLVQPLTDSSEGQNPTGGHLSTIELLPAKRAGPDGVEHSTRLADTKCGYGQRVAVRAMIKLGLIAALVITNDF